MARSGLVGKAWNEVLAVIDEKLDDRMKKEQDVVRSAATTNSVVLIEDFKRELKQEIGKIFAKYEALDR